VTAFQTLPGFREFLPGDCALREHFFRVWRSVLRKHGFEEWDGPALEPLDLYVEKSGPEIVGQLFHFEDRGERAVALRPELTPTLARLVGERAQSLKRPVKWFSIGEFYRFERPQKGRLRAFYQLNVDLLGEAAELADAEVLAIAVHLLQAFQLEPTEVGIRLSDRTLWTLFLESLGVTGPEVAAVLQVIDKMDRVPEEKTLEALEARFPDQAADFLAKVHGIRSIRGLDEIEAFFSAHLSAASGTPALGQRLQQWRQLMNHLEALGLAPWVEIDLGIVRGLAYYTGFVFEAFEKGEGGRALAGGGRYDSLIERMGGPAFPAVGFALGDVTFRDTLENRGKLPRLVQHPDVFVITAGEDELNLGLGLISRLRSAGYAVDYSFRSGGFGKKFREAGQSGAPLGLILGSEERESETVKLRDFRSREEWSVPQTDLLTAVARFFSDSGSA